jgi:predicted nuclease with TOPRIM domain
LDHVSKKKNLKIILKNLKIKFEMIREERDSLLQVTDQQKKQIDFLENKVKLDEEEKQQLSIKVKKMEIETNDSIKKMEEIQQQHEELLTKFENLSIYFNKFNLRVKKRTN